jgi:hypothetical protein
MILTLTIDLDTFGNDATGDEVGRILRYWGGAAKDLDWSQPIDYPLMDSGYTEVGRLTTA